MGTFFYVFEYRPGIEHYIFNNINKNIIRLVLSVQMQVNKTDFYCKQSEKGSGKMLREREKSENGVNII